MHIRINTIICSALISWSLLGTVNAEECPNDIALERFNYDSAVDYLKQSGFIKQSSGKRNYATEVMVDSDAELMLELHSALTSNNDKSLLFWLTLTGSALKNNNQAGCFIRSTVTLNQNTAVTFMQYISRLIKKTNKHTTAETAMFNIAREMDGDAILAYLKAEKAVYFTSGGMGTGVNYANARHNKKRVQHIPNDIMKILADRLEAEGNVHRSTIYQVRHMGYED